MSEASRQRPLIDLDDLERQLRDASRPRHTEQGAPADDPLAELARIVGQDDPFRAAFQSSRRQDGSGHDHRRDDEWRDEEPRAPNRIEPELRAEASARDWPEPKGAQVVAFDDYLRPGAQEGGAGGQIDPDEGEPVYEEQGQLPPHDADYGEEPAPRRARKGLYVAASLSGLALIGVIGVASLGGSGGGKLAATQTPPVIKADAGPIKVAPQNPGGVDVPNQNQQIYDRAAEAKAAKIVGSNEQPVDVAQATRKDIAQTGSTAEQGALQMPRPLPSGAPIPGLGEPKRVRTVLVRPDGSVIDGAPAPAASAPAATAPAPRPMAMAPPMPTMIAPPMPGIPGSANPRAPTTPNAAVKNAAPTSTTAAAPVLPKPAKTTPSADTTSKAAPTVTATTPAPAKPAAPPRQQVAAIQPDSATDAGAAASAGGFSVQLAAPASEQEAKDTLGRLQRRFGSELTGYKLGIRKADIGDRTVYRIRVGGLSREDASGLCAKLQAAGGQCFIAKN